MIDVALAYPITVLMEAAESWLEAKTDVTWAELAGMAAVGSRQGMTVKARVVGNEVIVTVSVRHLGRFRGAWAQVRVEAWDGVEPWEEYHKRAGAEICGSMGIKLASRER